MTNEYKLVMYENKTKRINSSHKPKSQTRNEREVMKRRHKQSEDLKVRNKQYLGNKVC